MLRFSERMGLKPVRSLLQVDSMDDELRNRLWNLLCAYVWNTVEGPQDFVLSVDRQDDYQRHLSRIVYRIWHEFYKLPFNKLNRLWVNAYQQITDLFLKCEWLEVYEFIEFVASKHPEEATGQAFASACNQVLKEELSAYRFVDRVLVRVTSEEEIAEIEEALETPLTPVRHHLKAALDALADRENPNYRNSIKESISAVEAICKLVAKNDKATLGQALEQIKGKAGIHTALEKGFKNLYGYTSDAGGIRHSLKLEEDPDLSFEDAKFFLVACSAFINYVITKADKAGIEIQT